MTNSWLKEHLLRSTMIVGLAAGVAIPSQVFAQDADDEEEDRITVTGSRIERVDVDTARPSLNVDSEELDRRAFTNLADALNEVPTFGNGISPDGAQNAFTVGQNFVDLFDLGTARTLTLVNGRRFVSSNVPNTFSTVGGLQVDLNTLPVALLERIEVVPLAGAAVYGSDSIAGTVNVILRDDYEGAEISGQYGFTEDGGGLEQYQVQAVFGGNFADGRGNAVLAVEYNKQGGALLRERPFFFANDPNLVSFGTGFSGLDADGDGDPDQEFRIDYDQTVQLFGEFGSVSPSPTTIPSIGLGTIGGQHLQFDAQGNLGACTPGNSPGATSLFFAQGGDCGIDFFDSVAQIRSPLDRINITSLGHYDITDDIRFFVETTFSNSNASELVNQGGFQTFAFGGSSGPLNFSTANPFLSDQARGVLEGNGLNSFWVNRFNNDVVNLGENSTENFTWRVATGLEGEFERFGRRFNWEVSGVFGQADIETRTLGIVDGRFINAIDAVRLDAASLQPIIDAGFAANIDEALDVFNRFGLSGVGGGNAGVGDIVCQVSIDIAAGTEDGFNQSPQGGGINSGSYPFADGCRPVNLFGDAGLLNDPATLNWINGAPRITSTNNAQRVFNANMTGQVYELPGGWISLNAGYETRRERAEFTPGLGTALDVTRSSPFSESGGQQITQEVFGEIYIPVVTPDMDFFLTDLLELNASVRRVNDEFRDLTGNLTGDNTSTAYEVNGRWRPIEDITVRGSFTKSIRSPSLVELFSPEVQAFLFASDPCDARFIDGGIDPATRRANCQAEGIPDGFTSNVVNASIIGANEGNPALTPERATSYNIGVVLQPRWFDRMALSLDYFRIAIEDRISGLSLTQIMGACYDSPSFPNTPACSDDLFLRDENFQVVFGKTTNLNAANSLYRGLQGRWVWIQDTAEALSWLPGMEGQFDGSDLGEFEFNVTVLRALQNESQVLDELPADPIGSFGDPKWQGTFDTTYRFGDFRFFWRTLWQDKPLFSTTGNSYLSNLDPVADAGTQSTAANIIDEEQSDRLIHNASLQYVYNNTALQLTVNNVFAREPSDIDFASGNFGTSEQLGRQYILRLRHNF